MNNIKDIHKLAGLISPADLEILDEAAALHKKKYLIFDLNTPHLIFINLAWSFILNVFSNSPRSQLHG